jgi:RNA recognition motif-containing protein
MENQGEQEQEHSEGGGEQQDYTDFKDPTNSKLDVSNGGHSSGGYGNNAGTDYDQVDANNNYTEPHHNNNRYLTPYSGSHDPSDTYNVFVGDINLDVTEDDLKEIFSPCGTVKSVLIFRDRVTNEPKGFGFVHFQTKAGQQVALSDEYNHIQIKGRPCRVRPEQKTTLFVGNIPKNLNVKEVHDALYNFVGAQMEVELKTGPPPTSESRGFAFVTFGNHQTADKSRKTLVASAIKERPLNVSWAEPQEDADADTMASVRTLYVNNLHANVSDNVLGSLFSQYGVLVNCAIVKNPQTKESRGFAFVEFKVGIPSYRMNVFCFHQFFNSHLSLNRHEKHVYPLWRLLTVLS